MQVYEIAQKFKDRWKDTHSTYKCDALQLQETFLEELDDGQKVRRVTTTPMWRAKLIHKDTAYCWHKADGRSKEEAFEKLVATIDQSQPPITTPEQIAAQQKLIADLKAELAAAKEAGEKKGRGGRTAGGVKIKKVEEAPAPEADAESTDSDT